MLALNQRIAGHDVRLVTVARREDKLTDAAVRAGAEGVEIVRFAPSFPRALVFSWQMLAGLDAVLKDADMVHVHSNWTFPVWWGCRTALKYGKRLIMTPHGCLSPERLAHSRWKKRLAGLVDRRFLRRADVLHATCEEEADAIKAFRFSARMRECASARFERVGSAGPVVVVVPNGVEIKGLIEPDGSGLRVQSSSAMRATADKSRLAPLVQVGERGEVLKLDEHERAKRTRTVLYLGRLHSLKGLEMLISAWAEIRGSSASGELLAWRLVIAGPDEQGTLKALKAQVERLGVTESVTFAGSVYGEAKQRLLAEADLFVLPSRHENFGLTVVEALAAGVPMITTKGTPWSELEGKGSNVPQSATGLNGLRRFRLRFLRQDKGSRVQSSSAMRATADKSRLAPLPASIPTPRQGFKGSKVQGIPKGLVHGDFNERSASSFIHHPSSFSANGRCGWWVDIGVEPLTQALREAMSLSDAERRAMGENGRKLVEEKYQWKKIAEQMTEVYKQA